MTQLAYPFSAGAGAGIPSQARWMTMLRSAWRAGDGPIKALDRIFDLNRLECFGDSTGLRVKVKSGRAQMRGFHYVSDAEEILTIAAADATNPRIDRVVLHLDADLADNQCTLQVIPGTPAGSPVAPTPSSTATVLEIPLAQVRVNAAVSTITAGNVSDERPFLLSGLTPAGVLRRSANQTIPHAALTTLAWTTTDRDTDGATSGAGFTCKTPGWYDADLSIEWATTQTNGLRIAYLALTRGPLGGTGGFIAKSAMTATVGETAQTLGGSAYLQIGDVIAAQVVQSNAAVASLDVLASSLHSPRLTVGYVGP